jgi:LysM repeat protein
MAKSIRQDRLHQWLQAGLAVILVLSMLAISFPQAASAAPVAADDDCKRPYEVKRLDTLNKISRFYGINVASIVAENDMDKPYTIYVGQQLCIPKKNISGAPKIASKYANAYAVYFVAGRSGNDILIYTYNYPKTTVSVKGENAGKSGWKLVTIGEINIARVGNGKTMRFRLPTELRVKKLLICLKDMTTGHLQCVYPRSGS